MNKMSVCRTTNVSKLLPEAMAGEAELGSRQGKLTNVQQDCAVELLVDDMGLEDLVVESLRGSFGNRHCVRLERESEFQKQAASSR